MNVLCHRFFFSFSILSQFMCVHTCAHRHTIYIFFLNSHTSRIKMSMPSGSMHNNLHRLCSLKRFTRTQMCRWFYHRRVRFNCASFNAHNPYLCTMCIAHICNAHKANATIKQNGNKQTNELKKATAHTHTYDTERLCMQTCRSCHQNNTNSSINMIIVAFYYDFSDTILTARRPMQTI